MSTSREKHLSLKELKGNIREALQKSGALNTVKAQIRREFVEGFKDSTALQSKRKRDYKLYDRILLSVIYHHFKFLNLKHSLSVFVAESGFDSSALIDAIDIPLSLNFGTESKIYRSLQKEINQIVDDEYEDDSICVKKVTNSSKSVLELLVNESCASARTHNIETSCQTDLSGPGVRETLDQQVRELHLSYTTRRETERLLPNKTIEERMIAFQRECEDRLRKDYESQLNIMRTVEISRVRTEEANKKREELELARKELEGAYQHRLQAQMDREQESIRVAADKARQSGLLEYEARQRMQRELDDLRLREESSRRKIELETQGIRMLESRLKESQLSIESRERELARKEKELVLKTNEIITQVRDEASRTSEREMDAFLRDKATLMLERKRFEEEKESDASRQMALAEMRNKFRDMQDTIEARNDEIASLNSALIRIKNSVMSENSSAAKLLEEYGVSDSDIATNNTNSKLDSMVLLIKKNAELETRNNQLSIQLASTQADLDREHNKKGDLSEKFVSCKQELQLMTDSSLEKDKTIIKLTDDNEKLKRMLTNVRRARLALSEESKELEQLVGEQRAIIVQMRKANSRDAALSHLHSNNRGGGGGDKTGGAFLNKENRTYGYNRMDTPVDSNSLQRESNIPSASISLNPKDSHQQRNEYSQSQRDQRQQIDYEEQQLKQLALDRQRELDYELEVIKRRGLDEARQRQIELERQRQFMLDNEAAKLREIQDEKQRQLQLQNADVLKLREGEKLSEQLQQNMSSQYNQHVSVDTLSPSFRDIGMEKKRLEAHSLQQTTSEKQVIGQAHELQELNQRRLELPSQREEERQREETNREKRVELLRVEEVSKREQEVEARNRLNEVEPVHQIREADDMHKATLDREKEEIEEITRKQETEEAERRKLAEEEAERRKLAEEEAERRKLAEGEAERRKLAEEEAERRKLAEEEAERRKLAEQEAERRKLAEEEAERRKLAEDEAEKEKKIQELEARARDEERTKREEAEAAEEAKAEAEKRRVADEEEARRKEAEDSEMKERELEKTKLQEAEQLKIDEERKQREAEEQKKKDDMEKIASARAKVLARRQQQKMRKEEEPVIVEKDPPATVTQSDPLSPSNGLSDSDIRSNDGEDSSDYDWS